MRDGLRWRVVYATSLRTWGSRRGHRCSRRQREHERDVGKGDEHLRVRDREWGEPIKEGAGRR